MFDDKKLKKKIKKHRGIIIEEFPMNKFVKKESLIKKIIKIFN